MNYSKVTIFTIFCTAFLYLEHFGYGLKLLNTLFGLSAFLLLFTLTRKELFVSGTFIGIVWFWWIGYSFVYYELEYLVPIVILLIGIGYGLLFFIGGYFQNIYLRALYFFFFSFIAPFGFNWFKFELLFVNSYIGVSKVEFLIILLISAFTVEKLSKSSRSILSLYFGVIVLLVVYNSFNQTIIDQHHLKIKQLNTHIQQNEKWEKNNQTHIVDANFDAIEKAIQENYDLIIFPETAFPFVLNNAVSVLDELLNYSEKISIVTGALYVQNGAVYNSTYMFQKRELQIAHKVVLVPFGEAVPFPAMIRNWINDTFYNGASDYTVADKPTTFNIQGEKFRNAICYEATTDKIFENLDTQYVVAISNNAWFVPSHQPTLQKLLMNYYEKIYKVKIISVTNQ